MKTSLEYALEAYFEIMYPSKKPKLKVHPQDDRIMEDGTINPNHYTLKSGYMSDFEFNARQRASKYH